MKVNSLSGFNGLNNYTRIRQNSAQNAFNKAYKHTYAGSERDFASAPVPLGAYNVVNFTGGYSIDLAQTVGRLPETAYPAGIRELAIKTLENGNLEDKTLIDVHKEKYGKISEMETLDEVKAEFPEFRDVLSDDEIEYVKNSFIDDVKQDRIEAFDPDVDLALQLLQMYWAEGFSLSDLKEYTNGKNIFSVLEKLNIPRLNSTYGSVLKLSNKEYNEKITGMMSERQKDAAVRRAEKKEGVYIPRGPLSDEHKKKISESLIKHYGENPEKTLEMSERMKRYYREHPQEREKLGLVLTTAWNLPEARSVRKKLSKFMGKKDISSNEFTKMMNEEMSTQNASNGETSAEKPTLKAFWRRNTWAREHWSKAMKKAWELVNSEKAGNTKEISQKTEILKNIEVIDIYPAALKNDMRKWLGESGYDLNKFTSDNFQAVITYGRDSKHKLNKYADEAIAVYFQDERRIDLRANMYQICMFMTMNDIMSEVMKMQKQPTGEYFANLGLCTAISSFLMNENNLPKVIGTEEVMNFYVDIFMSANDDVKKLLAKNLEGAYEIMKNGGENIEALKVAATTIKNAQALGNIMNFLSVEK